MIYKVFKECAICFYILGENRKLSKTALISSIYLMSMLITRLHKTHHWTNHKYICDIVYNLNNIHKKKIHSFFIFLEKKKLTSIRLSTRVESSPAGLLHSSINEQSFDYYGRSFRLGHFLREYFQLLYQNNDWFEWSSYKIVWSANVRSCWFKNSVTHFLLTEI